MLKRVGTNDLRESEKPVSEAAFPQPFGWTLEYCPPVYESWNIVHIGMLIPGAHQIYVCADNCMRGVTMTAAEMGESERFHCVILHERDMLYTNLEEITINGVSEVIDGLPEHPPAVLVFTVCVHHFLASDLDHIYSELGKRYPDILFLRCWMDPVMQKNHRPPDVTERAAMLDALPALEPDPRQVNLFGADLAHDRESELERMVRSAGARVTELPRMTAFEEFLGLGRGGLSVVTYPPFLYGAERFSERLGRPCLYLPPSTHYDEIDREISLLADALGVPAPDTAAEKELCERELALTREALSGIPVAIDYISHTRPLGLARIFLEHGISVGKVYIDMIGPEEEKDFLWLQEHAPALTLSSTIRPRLRTAPRGGEGKVLAIGPKAAFYEDTPYFVDVIECGGTWGYSGIRRICREMRDALDRPKEVRSHVTCKGAGNRCIPFEGEDA